MADTYLVGLSGPPRSGKDTLAGLVRRHFVNSKVRTQVHSLSLPMRLAVYAYLGLEYSPEHYEANKDYEFDVPGERRFTTIRNEMISLSEHFVKPRLGHGWWGRALLNRVTPGTQLILVPDMGFRAEHEVFTETLTDCLWIHLQRDGTDFSKDSRSYVGSGPTVRNNRSPEVAADRIIGHIEAKGWF